MRIDSLILRPEYRFRRSWFGSTEDGEGEVDSEWAATFGSEEEVFDVVAEGSAWPRAVAGTEDRARSRLSIESSRSAAKRWMANCRAESMSRFVRSCRLR